ncbi:MAG: DNA methylase, partial [Eubacterium sp.]|nr:DNA methylase [Eubacterium sp.]
MERTYIAIDLKSFYASVECRELGRDPLTTNLVVADDSRTEKTICLAVSPSLKAYGIPGRARLFEVVQAVRRINGERLRRAPGHSFAGRSDSAPDLASDPSLELGYITATPRMALYMEYSTRIYDIYLKYIAPEDIHVYSIDEVLMDVTGYLNTYHMTARQLAMLMIQDVLSQTGITATAGIGTNLYLAKIAMDLGAKHVEADKDGVRIAYLDEMSYRRLLWDHKPLTDFWRIGKGYAGKLAEYGLETMGDIARCSLMNEDLLYDLFGVNAELLIDHAWGWEPCTMDLIKEYKPENNSISSGQVLQYPYDFEKARNVIHEMAEAAALDLVDK